MPRVAGQGEPRRVTETPHSHRDANLDRATLMSRLVAVSDSLRGSRSPEAAAAAVGRALLMLTGAPRGAVFLRSQSGIVTCPWSHNLSEDYVGRLRTPEGANPWAHLSRHPELACMDLPARGRIRAAGPSVVEDVRSMPAGNDTRRAAEREGIRALCAWPLSRGGRVFAAMVYYFDAPHACSDAEREVVLAFALQAITPLEQALAAEARGEAVGETDPAAGEDAAAAARLEIEAARLAALQRALDAEGARLSAERTDLAVERERLGAESRELDADRERLDQTRRLLETESERFAATRAELEADRARLGDLRREAEEEQAKLETSRRELDLERFQLNGLREEMGAARAELAKARTELEAEHGGVAQARAELETGRGAVVRARAELERERERIGNARAELDAEREALLKARADVEADRVGVVQVREDLEKERGGLDDVRRTTEGERARLEELRRTLEAERSRIAEAQASAARDGTAKQTAAAELEQEKSRLIEAHSELTAAEGDVARARATLEAEAARLADARREVDADRARVAELQRTLDADRTRVTEAQRAVDADRTRLGDAHRTLETERVRLAELQRALEAEHAAVESRKPEPAAAPFGVPAKPVEHTRGKTASPVRDTKTKKPAPAPRTASGADSEARPINSVMGRQTAPDKYRERLAGWAEAAARALGCQESEILDVKRAAVLQGVDTMGREIAAGVATILKHRAERWDGAGTPDHLKENAIPLGARILAVAIAYADMVTGGPGNPMLYYLDAKAQLRRGASGQFDPEVVQVFCRVVDRG